MNEQRRTFVGTGLGLGVALLSGSGNSHAGATAGDLDPIPPLPTTPTPGKPGDFDFLTGEWRIHHRQLRAGSNEWLEFDGEATVHGILGGVGSVEELRIPARNFSGLGLRLLDVEKRVWADHWVNAKSGVMTVPGMPGSFENGAGIFVADDQEDGKPVKSLGVWDLITPKSCRWRQAISRDGGKTWQQTWLMDWRRV
jgi:hypothetical protein